MSRLLETRSLTSWYALSAFSTLTPFLPHKIHHSYTHTHIHANAFIPLVLDVNPERLAKQPLKPRPIFLYCLCYTTRDTYSRAPGTVLGSFPELPIPHIYSESSRSITLRFTDVAFSAWHILAILPASTDSISTKIVQLKIHGFQYQRLREPLCETSQIQNLGW